MSLDTLIPMIKPSEVELIVSKRKQTLSNRMIFGIILYMLQLQKTFWQNTYCFYQRMQEFVTFLFIQNLYN